MLRAIDVTRKVLCFGLGDLAGHWVANVSAVGSFLPDLDIPKDRLDVVTEPSRVFVSRGPYFSDDWVNLWRMHGWIPSIRLVCK